MSRFVGDARDFRRPDEPRVLILTEDLLDELGVAGCHRNDQERAVKRWLVTNRPNKILTLSLQEDGFPDANLSNNLSNEPRRTGTDGGGRADVDMAAELHERGRSRIEPDGASPDY